MRKILLLLAIMGSVCAAPVCAEPAADLQQFRQFFKGRFPAVAFGEYADGLVALPGFDVYREQWLTLRDRPAFKLGLANGKALWEKPFANGRTFAECFKNGGRNIAQGYPYWDKTARKIRTVEMDLVECARRNQAELEFLTADLDRDEKARAQLAELSAYFYSMSRGKAIVPDVDFTDPEALKAYEAGKRFWWSRRGQWNFACASCHVELSGKSLGGNQPLSAGLGHGAAWPAHRLTGDRIDLLHQRYTTCLSQMRAKPPKIGAEIYNQLELYEKFMSSGLPLRAPAVRD